MKHLLPALLFAISISTNIHAQTQGAGVTDIDGNTYQTVIIGEQEWMVENLRTSRFRNGNAIPNVTENSEWSHLSSPAWAYYDNDSSLADLYGKLYNGYAVNDDRRLCPEGWVVPSDDDWKTLEFYLGMPEEDLDKDGWDRGREANVGGKLKSEGLDYWESPNSGATNESGFTGLVPKNRTLD